MINENYFVFESGEIEFWWSGTTDEIRNFKQWIDSTIPNSEYGWWNNDNLERNTLRGHFTLQGWAFITHWWSQGALGPVSPDDKLLKWKLSEGTAVFPSRA